MHSIQPFKGFIEANVQEEYTYNIGSQANFTVMIKITDITDAIPCAKCRI
jgi:hypothetical protein